MNGYSREDRLRELLADQALGLLSGEAERELVGLGPDDGRVSFETAAAAALLALLPERLEPLPQGLAERLVAQARTHTGDGP